MTQAAGTQSPAWGARLHKDGAAVFRLWAPAEHMVSVRVTGEDRPMRAAGGGWFELRANGLTVGTAYAFVLGDGMALPDPASRQQAGDVHGPSLLVDGDAYQWHNPEWRGRPWEEAVLYELHVGAFTPEGTFRAAAEKLHELATLGITAIEIMPVAQFGGERGWGYDGVLLYAPHPSYGTPDDLRALVDRAHDLNLMVLLDVVYNHFGPDGNYIGRYAPDFFDPERHTPWGPGIAYHRPPVRRFFLDNALYWIGEFMLDGLRFDAIDQVRDPASPKEILVEIAETIRIAFPDRHVHLCTEDNRNITRLHVRDEQGVVRLFSGEWNDDFHNICHAIATGESEGYYTDFTQDRWRKLARALAEGFVYQGEPSTHAGGKPRGEPSAHLPPTAFIDFLQNHDQTGNRAFGERLISLAGPELTRALTAILLLSPHIPLLFMGEEWGETNPFCFFTDFHGELADKVREGRRREFAGFAAFAATSVDSIPDPNAPSTFEASKIDWEKTQSEDGKAWLTFFRVLLNVRREHIVPLLAGAGGNAGEITAVGDGVIAIDWRLHGGTLSLRANLSQVQKIVPPPVGAIVYAYPAEAEHAQDGLPARAVLVGIDLKTPAEA